jgi:hypothetical protein
MDQIIWSSNPAVMGLTNDVARDPVPIFLLRICTVKDNIYLSNQTLNPYI